MLSQIMEYLHCMLTTVRRCSCPRHFHHPALLAAGHTLSPVISFENRCIAWRNTRSVHLSQPLFPSQHASHKGGVPLAAKCGGSDASLSHSLLASQTIRTRPMIEAPACSLSTSHRTLDEVKISKVNALCSESVKSTELGVIGVSLFSVGTLTIELQKRKGFG